MQGNELRNLYGALGRCRRRMNFADGYATDKVHLLYIKLCDGIAVENLAENLLLSIDKW